MDAYIPLSFLQNPLAQEGSGLNRAKCDSVLFNRIYSRGHLVVQMTKLALVQKQDKLQPMPHLYKAQAPKGFHVPRLLLDTFQSTRVSNGIGG